MRLFLLPLIALLVTTCSDAQLPKPTSLTPPNQPNILLFLADDWSYPHATIYGDNTVKTPNFDALARGGRRFTNAYCASPSCSPSRASLLTGRYPHQNGAAGNLWSEFPAELTVYPEVLEAAGYRTGFDQKGWAPGDWRASGRTQNPTGKHKQDLRDFLDEKAPDQPFCFWFGTYDPHRKYERGLGVLTGMKPDSVEVPAFLPDLPCVRNDLLDYYAEIERLDRHLGQAVELLRARGELDNTLIIVTSDNGMPFPRSKGQTYELSHHMPLAIRWGRGITAPGRTIDDFVSFVDFAPTFLDAAGITPDRLPHAGPITPTGRSLRPIFESAQSGRIESDRDAVILGKERHDLGRPRDGGYPSRGLVSDRWLLTLNARPDRWPAGNPETGYMNTDGGPTKTAILNLRRDGIDRRYWDQCFGRRPAVELFDLQSDPDCLTNLAGMPGYAETQSTLTSRLQQVLVQQGDPRATGDWPDGVTDFDDYPYSQQRLKGFYEKWQSGWTDDRGRGVRAGWINDTDLETESVE